MASEKVAETVIVGDYVEIIKTEEKSEGLKSKFPNFFWHGGSVYDAWFSCASNQVEGVRHSGPTKLVLYFIGATNILYTFGGHAVTHLTDAQEWAGGGSMVGALVGSTQREPLVVGKPSTFMMDYPANEFGITKSQICMVGDRLDTDILFGQNGGCKTILVLSGVTSLSMLQNPNNAIQPDFYTNKISYFLSLKNATV